MLRADLLDRARRTGAALLALPELAARVDLIASGLSGVARLASHVHAVRVGVEDLRAELAAVRVEAEALRAERDAAAMRARDVLDDAAARMMGANCACVCVEPLSGAPTERVVPARWGGVVSSQWCSACGGWRGHPGVLLGSVADLARVVEALEPRPRVRPTLAELVRDEVSP